jgi:hypothetical protein
MIYLMPIDECPRCGARTPRIFTHRCSKQEENGRLGADFAAELQAWIASQVAAGSARAAMRADTTSTTAQRLVP